MPALVAGGAEEGGAADRLADGAIVDELAGCLVGAAEEGVGRAADAQALGFGRVDQLLRFGQADAQRLLRMDVLAGGDRLEADLDMGAGHGEVDDDSISGSASRSSTLFTGMPNSAPRASAAARFMSATARTAMMFGNTRAALR